MLKRYNTYGTSRLATTLAVAAAAAVVASLAIAGTAAAQFGPRFNDVPQGHYAYAAIDWAAENEITRGCGDGRNFCPGDTLNRAQMVTLLKRYHDMFVGTSASGGSSSGGVVATLSGIGDRTSQSVRLSSGRWEIEFDVEHDSRLAGLTLTAIDENDNEEILVDELVNGDDYGETFTLRISSASDTLDPGRIWFEVDTRNDAEWTIRVIES